MSSRRQSMRKNPLTRLALPMLDRAASSPPGASLLEKQLEAAMMQANSSSSDLGLSNSPSPSSDEDRDVYLPFAPSAHPRQPGRSRADVRMSAVPLSPASSPASSDGSPQRRRATWEARQTWRSSMSFTRSERATSTSSTVSSSASDCGVSHAHRRLNGLTDSKRSSTVTFVDLPNPRSSSAASDLSVSSGRGRSDGAPARRPSTLRRTLAYFRRDSGSSDDYDCPRHGSRSHDDRR